MLSHFKTKQFVSCESELLPLLNLKNCQPSVSGALGMGNLQYQRRDCTEPFLYKGLDIPLIFT